MKNHDISQLASPKRSHVMQKIPQMLRMEPEYPLFQGKRREILFDLVSVEDKPWSEIGVAVYRVGVGMYHSS